jgi:murein L,D-transpeptidase YafK
MINFTRYLGLTFKIKSKFWSILSILAIIASLFILMNFEKQDMNDTFLQGVDYILIEKEKRLMSLYKTGTLLKQYKIALGFSPEGHKTKQGDGKTPEGIYSIVYKNPKSTYHLSLKISYPSISDVEEAKSKNVNPGGDIMIHGVRKNFAWMGKYHLILDWTRGCIAVSNDEIEEIYKATTEGTKVEIKP